MPWPIHHYYIYICAFIRVNGIRATRKNVTTHVENCSFSLSLSLLSPPVSVGSRSAASSDPGGPSIAENVLSPPSSPFPSPRAAFFPFVHAARRDERAAANRVRARSNCDRREGRATLHAMAAVARNAISSGSSLVVPRNSATHDATIDFQLPE